MEEKLRNLSKNIATNTSGEEHQPKEEKPQEEITEEITEDVSDYTPEPENQGDDSEKQLDQPEEKPDEPEEPEVDNIAKPANSDDGPRIISVEEAGDDTKEEKKYSPEVEAALNRVNVEESSDEPIRPLSTEPQKRSHAGPIILLILFVLAVAAVTLCVLVEKNVIQNPFPDLFKKQESSQTTQTKSQTEKSEKQTEPTESEKSSTEELLTPTENN